MIDVSDKKEVKRIASATGKIRLKSETIELIKNNEIKKGDVLEAARVSALLAVKKTPELIPHCHPIPITGVDVNFEILDEGVKVVVEVKATAKTGVEMESLIGVSAALLTIWDMVKYLEKNREGQYPDTEITEIRVTEKIKEDGSHRA